MLHTRKQLLLYDRAYDSCVWLHGTLVGDAGLANVLGCLWKYALARHNKKESYKSGAWTPQNNAACTVLRA